ncbi:hypothetical protein YPPY32_4247 [Yersinia pestis PY-32]|nr:hypothetical protein YPPY32_4247 [Yersinia pestis PY-32]
MIACCGKVECGKVERGKIGRSDQIVEENFMYTERCFYAGE